MTAARVLLGDCLDHLRGLPDNSADAIVTDPPYGLSKPPGPEELTAILQAWMAGMTYDRGGGGFLGKSWDAFVPDPRVWAECLRVVKPGGHLIAFAGSRTVDLMGLSLRLGGWEVRDSLAWVYWEGKPAGLNVGKAIDRRPMVGLHAEFRTALRSAREAAGLSRQALSEAVVGTRTGAVWNWEHHQFPEARHWPKLKNALPALDPKWGEVLSEAERDVTGRYVSGIRPGHAGAQGGGPGKERRDIPATPEAALWEGWNTTLAPTIEPALLCRKPLSEGTVAPNVLRWSTGALNIDACRWGPGAPEWLGPNDDLPSTHSQSATAANGLHTIGKGWQGMETHQSAGQLLGRWPGNLLYCPKASTTERERGCDGLPVRVGADRCNHGPCIKPVRLLRWLCRLVTPSGGLVVDPFAGTGSCGVAAVLEGFRYLGMELEGPAGEDYHSVAIARVTHAQRYPDSWVNTEPGRIERVQDPERKERQAKAGQQSLF